MEKKNSSLFLFLFFSTFTHSLSLSLRRLKKRRKGIGEEGYANVKPLS